MIDVLGQEKRRRRTTQEKSAIVQQSFEPGMTASLVARQHGGKRKANAVCNTCSLQTKLELLLN